eukprot:TRINITY_DN1365_c0_g1_i4.p1 TRINITY_DN1365_c0_g1~~TRINITY_DN1365_c0_g1_i4.p1  ORF type:complete len:162 (-),score=36.35 TRINITY_DN1365_c0_g1_i4:151-636(-)
MKVLGSSGINAEYGGHLQVAKWLCEGLPDSRGCAPLCAALLSKNRSPYLSATVSKALREAIINEHVPLVRWMLANFDISTQELFECFEDQGPDKTKATTRGSGSLFRELSPEVQAVVYEYFPDLDASGVVGYYPPYDLPSDLSGDGNTDDDDDDAKQEEDE